MHLAELAQIERPGNFGLLLCPSRPCPSTVEAGRLLAASSHARYCATSKPTEISTRRVSSPLAIGVATVFARNIPSIAAYGVYVEFSLIRTTRPSVTPAARA